MASQQVEEQQKQGVLVVGMKLNAECRERLTWIVAKLAMPGDHVIALHVHQQSALDQHSSGDTSELDPGTRKELDETFQSVLGVYQGLCTLKQMKLDIKVVVGASVKEALVDAARLEDATRLILGTSRFLPTGLSTSLAKYCLKKLSNSCSVTIIDRGKVIFERPGYKNPNQCSRSSAVTGEAATKTTPGVIVPRSMRKLNCSSNQQKQLLEASSIGNGSSSRSSFSESSDMYRSFPASPVSVLNNPANSEIHHQHSGCCTRATESSTAGEYDPGRASSPPNQGWPLRAFPLSKLGYCSSPSQLTSSSSSYSSVESQRELSVVNWALQIPNRSRQSNASVEDSISIDEELAQCSSETSIFLCSTLRGICSKNGASVTRFGLDELTRATSNFSRKNLVGRGGCSEVFGGVLWSGQTVAVKRLTPDAEHDQLVTEVEILSSLRHKSIISLLGYCITDENYMLVYNFATNGSLEHKLHGLGENSHDFVLDWPSRQKIAVSVAQALVYLHDGCPSSVIHRDVKSSNILISSNFDALLSDFGLARWAAPPGAPAIFCTDVVGTFGYLAPEYFMFGKLDEKTDVYSFGVVLLELITGKHPLRGQGNLVSWGRPLLEARNVDKLVDTRLKDYNLKEMQQMVHAAALCLGQSSQSRPRMRQICEILDGDDKMLDNCIKLVNQEYTIEFPTICELKTHLKVAMAGLDIEA